MTQERRQDLLTLFALLALVSAPLLFLRAGKPFLYPKEFALAACCALAFPLAAAGRFPLPVPLAAALALFAAAPLFPGVPAGTDAWDLFLPSLKVMLFLVFASAFAPARGRALALRALASATLLAASLALVQYYGVDWPDWRIRQGFSQTTLRAVFATFGNPNFLGEFLALVLCPLAVCALTPGRWRLLYLAAASTGFVALIVTMSRAAWLAFALCAGILLLHAATSGARARALARRAAPVALLFALAVLLVFSTGNPLNRGASMLSGVSTLRDRLLTPTGSVSKRILAWNVAAFGLAAGGGGRGAGSFGRLYLDTQAEFLATPAAAPFVPFADNFDHAHNDWLEDLFDLGVAGAAAAWLLPVFLAGYGLRLAWRGGGALHAACAASSVGWLLLRTVAFPERLPSSWPVYLALAALAVVTPVRSAPAPSRGARLRLLLATVPALFALHLSSGRLAADRLALAGLEALSRGEGARALDLAARARAVRPTADAFVLEGAVHAKAGEFAAAASAYEAALALTSDPVVHHNLALCRLALGDPRGARPALERALRVFPCHFEAMVPLGRILVQSGLVGPGVEALRRAARWRDLVFRNPALHDDRLFSLEKEAETAYLESLLGRGIVPGPSAAGRGAVRLVVPRLNARSVRVFGSFNRYDENGVPLAETREPGLWETEISGLPSGTHDYLLLVDGRKEIDPAAERVVFADGSGEVSILRVP